MMMRLGILSGEGDGGNCGTSLKICDIRSLIFSALLYHGPTPIISRLQVIVKVLGILAQ